MHQSNSALIQALLPQDPDNGDVYVVPNGGTVGGSTVIYLHNHKTGELLGTATQLMPIANVSKKYSITRPSSKRKIAKGDLLRITAAIYPYTSLVFIDGFGWVGKDHGEKGHVLEDFTYQVDLAIPIGTQGVGYYLYEQLCLTRLRSNDEHGREPVRKTLPRTTNSPGVHPGKSSRIPKTVPATVNGSKNEPR
jgi:hypothetical protein